MNAQPLLYRPYNNLRLRELRPRQAQCIADIRQAIKEGHKRIIVAAPCGFGKTVLSSHLIAGSLHKGTRPLFTCPAVSLVDQTVRSFEFEGIRDIGVMQANHERTDREAQVQVASVQTLLKRALPAVDFMILDETHRHFKGLNKMLDGAWKDKISIGLTATPWVKGMGLRWTKLIIPATIPQLIEEDLLTPTTLYVPEQIANRANIDVQKGEFTEASSSREMREQRIVGNVVETWKKLGPGEKTFMFCVNLDHAREQMAAFIDCGIPFGYIDAQTPREERTEQFAKMKYGEIAGIASVGCLIAGVDEDVRCIIDCAPTKSEISLVQRWGRGIRTASGKTHLVGLDHAGNNTDQGLGLFWEIFHDHLDTHKPHEKGVAYEGEKRPAKPKKCAVCNVLIPAGSAICKNCGAAMRATGVEHEEGELVVYGTQPKDHELTAAVAFLESKGLKFYADFGYENAIQKAVERGFVRKGRKREYSMQEKQDWYSGFLWLAQERGRNQGWAAHRYKEKFGVWPNQLKKTASQPSLEIEQYDRHCRIKWAKRQQKEKHAAQA
ncbi:DEAD/DEAH box helicase family protein [Patescibacteria group bacterium]|nr:DEAD/DEAH box helicase family protein [Patescibacteria group bacterium]